MAGRPKLFTCPSCRHTYLGHDPVEDCPRCGYDYRPKTGFRWDIVGYLVVILALLSFALMSSYYRESVPITPTVQSDETEKLPGSRQMPFRSPYEERGR